MRVTKKERVGLVNRFGDSNKIHFGKYTLEKNTLEKNTKKYTKTGVGGSKKRDRVNRFGDSGIK